jgi:hypothetical protein
MRKRVWQLTPAQSSCLAPRGWRQERRRWRDFWCYTFMNKWKSVHVCVMYAPRNAIPRPYLAAQLLYEILLAIGAWCDQLFAVRKAVHFPFTITHAHHFSKYSHEKLYTFCTSLHFLNCPLGFFNRIKFIDIVIAACHIVVLEKYANRDAQVSWTMTIRRWLMRWANFWTQMILKLAQPNLKHLGRT